MEEKVHEEALKCVALPNLLSLMVDVDFHFSESVEAVCALLIPRLMVGLVSSLAWCDPNYVEVDYFRNQKLNCTKV